MFSGKTPQLQPTTGARPGAAARRAAAPAASLGPSLQRSAGNQRVQRLLRSLAPAPAPGTRPGLLGAAEAAGRLEAAREARGLARADQVRFRVPTAADVKAILAAGKVPEDKLKASITTVLARMQKEGLLKSADPVADIVNRLFPAPGTFDEAELAKVVDVADRNLVYQKVGDAGAKVAAADQPNLILAVDKAIGLVDDSLKDAAGLKQVFGTQAKRGKEIYQRLRAKLVSLRKPKNIDAVVEADYNLDDQQTGLGGWASFWSQRVHLQTDIVKVTDADDTATTLIHECAHLASQNVGDKGYYATSGFTALSDLDKSNNAAHYEELPWRLLGKSKFPGVTFTPGMAATGGAITFEEEVRRDASEYLRKAWDKAVDVHGFLRDIRKDLEAGKTKSFKDNKKRILELSKLEHLTIHEQAPGPTTINLNDVVLAEGVAHATTIIQTNADAQPVPAAPVAPKTKKDYVEDVITGAINAYGLLTGSAADDRTLMDWLSKNYQKDL